MINRDERSIEKYLDAGADLCLCRELLRRALRPVGDILYAKKEESFLRVLDAVELACISAERNMLRDFPDLDSGAGDVFFRNFREPAKTELASLIDDHVKETLEEMATSVNAVTK